MGELSLSNRLDRVAHARRLFFESDDRPESLVASCVLRSWERCRKTGLNERGKHELDPIGKSALRDLCERNQRLLAHGLGIVQSLHEQIRDSGNVVILADAAGTLLHRVGDANFLDAADRVALTPGAPWDESRRGTNAVGTAIVERMPTEILGSEHFLSRNGFLTCSASPVFDPHGELIGVLDISGDRRAYQRHTLGLVGMGVQLLERNLFQAEFVDEILISLHLGAETLGCVQEAILAVSPDGAILGASRAAVELLGVSRTNLARADFSMLFDLSLDALIDRATGKPLALVALETRGGGRLYACVRNVPQRVTSRPGRTGTTKPSRPPVLRRAHQRPGIVLEDLRTGDMRMATAIDRATRICGKDIPLLVQGESGVGKELFAKAFHFSGARGAGQFVALNCAAIPENLIESELFGYVGGAFTGARKEGAVGKIQQAHGGTLFLDEIGDMPLQLQARLLRVLQERSVTPVGGSEAISVDVSLVCATHRTLREEVAAGRFREDLYYRVNGLTVTLPALRERSDLARLVNAILSLESEDRVLTVSETAMTCFERYDWPGNIRQLHNALRLAIALLNPDETQIDMEHLPEELFLAPSDASADVLSDIERPLMTAPRRGATASLEVIEREAIDQALAAADGNISAAARRLGISRNTLYRKLGRM